MLTLLSAWSVAGVGGQGAERCAWVHVALMRLQGLLLQLRGMAPAGQATVTRCVHQAATEYGTGYDFFAALLAAVLAARNAQRLRKQFSTG